MSNFLDRRLFLKKAAGAAAGLSVVAYGTSGDGGVAVAEAAVPAASGPGQESVAAPLFRISLAEWSLHRSLRRGDVNHLDFARVAVEDYGCEGVEYVNSFFRDKARDMEYLSDMKTRADGLGIPSLLIMCDNEGRLGDPDAAARTTDVENH